MKRARRHFSVRAGSPVLKMALSIVLSGLAAAGGSSGVLAQTKPLIPTTIEVPKPARLPDGKPNWTGFWSPVNGILEAYRGPGGVTMKPGEKMMRPPVENVSPMKSPYKEQYDSVLQQLRAGKLADPVALCLPPGMPRMMIAPYGLEILQATRQVAITSEWQSASRRVWMDLSKHPDPEELDPTYAGHSIGRWEGDTLVVDTVGIRKDVPLDFAGLVQSGKVHVTERFKMSNEGYLEDEITVDDPDTFTKPWMMVKQYRYRPDLRLQEYVCLENNRNVGVNGEATFEKK